MSFHKPNLEHLFLNRRELLTRCGTGLGMLGLTGLLGEQGMLLNHRVDLRGERKKGRTRAFWRSVRPDLWFDPFKHSVAISNERLQYDCLSSESLLGPILA